MVPDYVENLVFMKLFSSLIDKLHTSISLELEEDIVKIKQNHPEVSLGYLFATKDTLQALVVSRIKNAIADAYHEELKSRHEQIRLAHQATSSSAQTAEGKNGKRKSRKVKVRSDSDILEIPESEQLLLDLC